MSAIKVGHKNKVDYVFMQKKSRSWAGTEEILPEDGQLLCGKVSSIHGFVMGPSVQCSRKGPLWQKVKRS